MSEPLELAPPTLYTLFPESKTLQEKAFKFLETRYEMGSDRRTAKVLKIDHKTVKSIHEFLLQTEAGYRFNAMLAEQTQDFFSKKTLTDVFGTISKKIAELELELKKYTGTDQIGIRLKINAELRQWATQLLNATLSCRPITGAIKKQVVDDEARQLSQQYKDLLGDDYVVTPNDNIDSPNKQIN